MPSRWVCWLIAGGWAASTIWFVHREIWPRFAPNVAPRVVIELSDEAVRQALPVRWSLYRNGQFLAPARTVTEYVDTDDTFRLVCSIFKFELLHRPQVVVRNSRSTYGVSRGGIILSQSCEVELALDAAIVRTKLVAELRGDIACVTIDVDSPWGKFQPPPERIRTSGTGVLNPLHPINRLQGLRIGQRWRTPEIDPLSAALRIAIENAAKNLAGADIVQFATSESREISAEVVGPRDLDWGGSRQHCLVIEWRTGGDLQAQTWVRADDGLVIRQLARLGGEELILVRE